MSDQEKMAEEIARLHLELEFEREAWELTIKSMLLYRNKFGWGEAEEEFMAKMQQEKERYLSEKREEYQAQQEGRGGQK